MPFVFVSAASLCFLVALAGAGCSRKDRSVSQRMPTTSFDPSTVAIAQHDARARAVNYPLKVSENRHHLVDQNGAPFLIQGDAAWSLFVQLKREEAAAYLEDRRRRGFNLVMVNLLEHAYADHPPLNAYGQGPFTTPGDFSTPNEPYFSHIDGVLREAGEKGIAVLLCPAYLGFGGGNEGWYQEMLRNGPAKLRDYGRRLGERYRGFDNIVWLEGGDFTPPPEHLELVNAVAEGIKERDRRHLHVAHWSPEVSGAEIQVSGWLDVNSTYTYGPVYVKSLADDQRNDGRPHFLIESRYENEQDWSPARLRAQAYDALLTGAAGHIFGNSPIWKFAAGWREALGSAGSVSMTNVWALFAPRDWTSLVPDTKKEVLVGGAERFGTPAYALAARSKNRDLAIAYLPTTRKIQINLAQLSGPVGARWYDPTSGSFASAAPAPLPANSVVDFRSPGQNSTGDEDWVLVLETAR